MRAVDKIRFLILRDSSRIRLPVVGSFASSFYMQKTTDKYHIH